jgi:hypothetical protein
MRQLHSAASVVPTPLGHARCSQPAAQSCRPLSTCQTLQEGRTPLPTLGMCAAAWLTAEARTVSRAFGRLPEPRYFSATQTLLFIFLALLRCSFASSACFRIFLRTFLLQSPKPAHLFGARALQLRQQRLPGGRLVPEPRHRQRVLIAVRQPRSPLAARLPAHS